MVPFDVHPGVAIFFLDDFVGHHLHFFRDLVETAPHEALDRENRVLGVGDSLPFGNLTDEPFIALGESNDRRRRTAAFGIRDDRWVPAFHHGHDRIGGSQVDPDNLAHGCSFSASLVF